MGDISSKFMIKGKVENKKPLVYLFKGRGTENSYHSMFMIQGETESIEGWQTYSAPTTNKQLLLASFLKKITGVTSKLSQDQYSNSTADFISMITKKQTVNFKNHHKIDDD